MTEVIDMGNIRNPHLNSEVSEKLASLGCCKICSLRYCGVTKISAFKDLYKSIEEKRHSTPHSPIPFTNTEDADEIKYTDTENGIKIVASNACIACLGMLQHQMSDKIIDKIVEAVDKEDYDNDSFNVAFTLPISMYLRAHSLLVFLFNCFPQHVRDNLPLGLVTVGVKDAWKYIFIDRIAQRINKTFNVDSEFKIQTDLQYEDDHVETTCLLDMYPNKFKDQKIKAKKLRHLKGPTLLFSRKSLESVLVLEERETFAQHYPVPPPVPNFAAYCNNVLFEHTPLYVAGRYKKFLRDLPQTAWLVQDQRKLETSVHELISNQVEALTKAQGSKLISSGREDVDVRMLGSGRPFALELLSPRHVRLSLEEMGQLEQRINSGAEGKVSVSQLKVVNKVQLEQLKAGEEHKRKTYSAWCVAWGAALDSATLSQLVELAPLTVQQRTPVRVLHRRPIAIRPRTIHSMSVSDIRTSLADPSESGNASTFFKLGLTTQAGTYIKEFIHGDFGRTKPSLGELLGGVTTDCLALDVTNIDLDWPPG